MALNKGQELGVQKIHDYIDGTKYTDKKFITISGEGGTGKTFMINEALDKYKTTHIITGAAISHSAVDNLRDNLSFGIIDTLAYMLKKKPKINSEGVKEFIPSFISKLEIPIYRSHIFVCDECSMIGKEDLKYILGFTNDCKIIFIGDRAQLPVIGEPGISTTFDNLVHELTQVMRFTKPLNEINGVFREEIIHFLDNEKFLKREVHEPKYHFQNKEINDVGYYSINTHDQIINKYIELYHNSDSPVNNIKIIAYKNETIDYFNTEIRKRLHPNKVNEQFMIGDDLISTANYMNDFYKIKNNQNFKIINLRETEDNDLHIYLLEIIDKHNETFSNIPALNMKKSYYKYKSRLDILKKNRKWQEFYRLKERFAFFNYGSCITSHKAQGSTYENVIVMESEIKSVKPITQLEKLQSIYVGISRARKKVYLF